jgi:phosphocarrier protein
VSAIEGIFTIRNRLGLHARAAAQFVKKSSGYRSEVWVEKDGQRVNGKSIMGLLMLACPLGTKLAVRVDGPDAEEAFADLGKLIEDGFGET